jgi:peptidoglycan/LPS O-acetylase OafA/YrhL
MTHTAIPERNLDVLRALAVLYVLAVHVLMTFGTSSPEINVAGRGAVVLFFVHTSLVLMASLERSPATDGWAQRFYVRRAFRIYPLAIATVLLTVALHVPVKVPINFAAPSYHAPTLVALTENLTLTQNLFDTQNVSAVLWTLPLEVQMYAVLPLCFLLARRSVRLLAIVLVGSIVAGSFAIRDTTTWTRNLLFFAPCFLSGVLAYALLRHAPRRRLLAPSAIFIVFVLALVIHGIVRHALTPGAANAIVTQLGWVVAPMAAFGIAYTRDLNESWFTRAAHVVATYSYSIYLLHVPVLWFSFVVLHDQPLVSRALIATVLFIAAVALGYHGIERPGIALGRWIAGGRKKESRLSAAVVPAP